MTTFLNIPIGSQSLAASLEVPARGRFETAAPVVVCCHGLTGTRIGSCRRFVALGRRLVEHNIACLRFDFRGCGESDGEFADITSAACVEDLLAAVASLDHLPGCDPTRIAVVASSFGAFTTAITAHRLEALRALAFWAPVADPVGLVERHMGDTGWPLLQSQGWVDHFGQRLGPPFFQTLPRQDAPAALARSPVPLLVYHGSGDTHVPFAQGQAYAAALTSKTDVELHPIECTDHAMRSVAANDRILEGTVRWVRRYLHPDA